MFGKRTRSIVIEHLFGRPAATQAERDCTSYRESIRGENKNFFGETRKPKANRRRERDGPVAH